MAFTLTQPSYSANGSYTAAQDRLFIKAATQTAGVRVLGAPSGGLAVGDLNVRSTATGNASVSVAAGDVVVAGVTGGGNYFGVNDAATTVGPLAACPTNTRIDLIVVRVSDPGTTPVISFQILTGTAAVSPVAPTPTVSSTVTELALASIAVPNGFLTTSTIGAGTITDLRPKGFLPNVGAVSNSATVIPSPAEGQLIFNTTTKMIQVYNGATWVPNNGVMVFASTALRDSAIPSPVNGMFAYTTDTGTFWVYSGAAWTVPDNDVQVFTIVGTATWTKPLWGTAGSALVSGVCIGGGGGGGGGRTDAVGTDRVGGGGGGGGARTVFMWRASDMSSSETVTVGAGGTGGTTSGSVAGNGGDGGFGGSSSIGGRVVARGGRGGLGGISTFSRGGASGDGSQPTFAGQSSGNLIASLGAGGFGTAGIAGQDGGLLGNGPGGGGGGGGIVIANTTFSGGAGGGTSAIASAAALAAGGSVQAGTPMGGGGGGGGTGGMGGGGAGGLYGGGGGGGGGCITGSASFAGAGAAGMVIIVTSR